MPVTIYIQEKYGYDRVDEALSVEESIQTIEEYAINAAEDCTEEDIERRFPMYWSVCELGASDITGSGYVNEFGEINP